MKRPLTVLEFLSAGYVRLREPALVTPPLRDCGSEVQRPHALRLVTWNVRAGLASSLDAVADILEGLAPDLVALQEVDRGVRRSGRRDQAAELGGRLGLVHVFAAGRRRATGDFGIALLSRFPVAAARRIELPAAAGWTPRVALDVEVCLGAHPLRLVTMHSDFLARAADVQARYLARLARRNQPTLLAGDLNLTPSSAGYHALIEAGLVDVLGPRDARPTFPGGRSPRRLDYVFADASLAARVRSARVVPVDASDHRPVLVDLRP